MQHDLAGLAHGLGLKSNSQPAVGFVRALEVDGRHRVREDEESRLVAAARRKALEQEAVFVIQHQLQALVGHVPWRLPIDRIAEYHVVGRNRLRDGPRGAARMEELARDFLPGADLRKCTVKWPVEVD